MAEILKTARLVLRAPDEGDIDRLVELAGDYEVSKMLAVVPHPYERDHAEDWIAHCGEVAGDEERSFAIDDGNGLIGAVSFRRLRESPRIGYWLGRPYWGMGYMSEAAHAALTWLFSVHDVTSVVAEAMRDNPASIAVLRKLGFADDGEGSCDSRARGAALPSLQLRLQRNAFLTTTQAVAGGQAGKELIG
ncbi:GNAT family N-acetyltransferase [Stappia sp. F7233]|uniref:GNAT family N-acetyltransferase n=1 Tax=Stappia albiluteola TaxID=2758565 RepID=A0A839AEP0_9HYPH|nr:GNAT family N-acetyltransferase [Stappia albiluteola]MBA5777049.1 GNAT family N-acetyltransferase [Stappia albiluteola]